MSETVPSRRLGWEVGPGDPRYDALLRKRFNKRFGGRPDYFRLVRSTEDVVDALEHAVGKNQRIAVQSGGHGLEGFVSDPAVRVVIDTSMMSSVYYDEKMGALTVEAGATLGEAYRKLFLGWGVTLPAGQSPDVGIGGHVLGGAFGFLHRKHGLAVDHLYAVEVVVVDESGKPRAVIATREESDPNRELWWAHTGCGGGNLGIVTRYFFRSPGATGKDPTLLLPRAPELVTTFKAEWSWHDLDEESFVSIVRNYEEWCERNSDPGSSSTDLFAVFAIGRPPHGGAPLRGIAIGDGDAEKLVDAFLAAIGRGVRAAPRRESKELAWLDFALDPFPDLFLTGPHGVAGARASLKMKDALLRKRHTDAQLRVAHDYLTRKYPEVPGGSFGLATYGGRMNAVARDATASAHRDAILETSYGAGWMNHEDEAATMKWVREFYRDVFVETGGVPAPNEMNAGALINHPDTDLADPEWNTSGVPWSTIYYGDNYPRLQRVKAKWDPKNVFHHALSIRAGK